MNIRALASSPISGITSSAASAAELRRLVQKLKTKQTSLVEREQVAPYVIRCTGNIHYTGHLRLSPSKPRLLIRRTEGSGRRLCRMCGGLSFTWGALQIQDRSPQLRPVVSECVCEWLRNATGLDCRFATRPWSFTWCGGCGHTSMNLCSQRVSQTSVHEETHPSISQALQMVLETIN